MNTLTFDKTLTIDDQPIVFHVEARVYLPKHPAQDDRPKATILHAFNDESVDWLGILPDEAITVLEETALTRAKAELYDKDDDHRQDG